MDAATRQRLEYPELLEMLARHASFPLGKEAALNLLPATDLAAVQRRQAATRSMRRFLQDRQLSLSAAHDIRPALAHVRRDGVLTGPQLVAVADTAAVFATVKQALSVDQDPVLMALLAGLQPLNNLVNTCRAALDADGYVKDEASQELAQLRARERGLQNRLRERMEGLLQRAHRAGYLQERHVTQRSGRYVLPVRAEYRHQVAGVLHGQSASGATVFIEPTAVVDLNNRLRVTGNAIQQEIDRILARLSRLVAEDVQILTDGLAALARIDLVLARARFADELQCVEPEINTDLVIDLKAARHPLLGPKAVPIDVTLGRDFDLLVITGPNTGGKTVALKTIGLFALMAQGGMHLPAAPGSTISLFSQVFADIGDEQSIQQSLSTFSAHMGNVVDFVHRCDGNSLVLLDEIGAGTDPDEGSALAMALLRHFRLQAGLTVATTHHSRLKAFALREPRAANAAVSFDPQTLAPTYRLLMGLPGRSHALNIAERLGMPEEILTAAQGWLGQEAGRLEEVIAQAEKARQSLESQQKSLTEEREEVASLRRQWEEQLADLTRRRQRWLHTTRAELTAQLNQLLTEAEDLLGQLRQAARRGQAGEAVGEQTRRRLARLRQQTQDLLAAEAKAAAVDETAEASPGEAVVPPEELAAQSLEQAPGPWPPEPGASVWVRPLQQVGQLVEYSDGGKGAVVQLGPLTTRVAAKDLSPPPKDSPAVPPVMPPRAKAPAPLVAAKAARIATELHLRGLTVDEALERLDKYIDDAVLAGLEEVRIVHGKGTGVLRREVGRFLAAHRGVAHHELAPANQGGAGVTVATLKP